MFYDNLNMKPNFNLFTCILKKNEDIVSDIRYVLLNVDDMFLFL